MSKEREKLHFEDQSAKFQVITQLTENPAIGKNKRCFAQGVYL